MSTRHKYLKKRPKRRIGKPKERPPTTAVQRHRRTVKRRRKKLMARDPALLEAADNRLADPNEGSERGQLYRFALDNGYLPW